MFNSTTIRLTQYLMTDIPNLTTTLDDLIHTNGNIERFSYTAHEIMSSDNRQLFFDDNPHLILTFFHKIKNLNPLTQKHLKVKYDALFTELDFTPYLYWFENKNLLVNSDIRNLSYEDMDMYLDFIYSLIILYDKLPKIYNFINLSSTFKCYLYKILVPYILGNDEHLGFCKLYRGNIEKIIEDLLNNKYKLTDKDIPNLEYVIKNIIGIYNNDYIDFINKIRCPNLKSLCITILIKNY